MCQVLAYATFIDMSVAHYHGSQSVELDAPACVLRTDWCWRWALSKEATKEIHSMIKGSCLCESVIYELSESPQEMSNCHCQMCRKSHGSAYATYARVKRDTLGFTEGEKLLVSYRLSPQGERFSCPTCSSPILFQYDKKPEVAWIAAGTLDDDPGIRPTEHIFVASKAPWHEITDEIEQHEGVPESFSLES